jgi:3,4-dihydroxy-2-butanone 4-phosphate synthase
MTRRFSDIETAIEALAAGRVVIVLDSAEREN